jgi:hypothetical protein
VSGASQRAPGEQGSAFGTLYGIAKEAGSALVTRQQPFAQELKAALHDRKRIVEVVSDTAGELSYRLRFLRLVSLLLGYPSLRFLGPRFVQNSAQLRHRGTFPLDAAEGE